ncbi:MAG: hypothetical protein JW395_1724 [Nitrospira sp.]|nr:hypothetical protein [Nitrospira sp.]
MEDRHAVRAALNGGVTISNLGALLLVQMPILH